MYRDATNSQLTSAASQVCIATASPAKFSEAMTSSGVETVSPQLLDELSRKPTRFTDLEREDDWYNILRQRIEQCTEMFENRATV
jgi:threonine synthase